MEQQSLEKIKSEILELFKKQFDLTEKYTDLLRRYDQLEKQVKEFKATVEGNAVMTGKF